MSVTTLPSGGSLWSGAVDAGNGWKYLAWFGYFTDPGTGWIYHSEHGWLYTSSTSATSIWLWSSRWGWAWISNSQYPYLWFDNLDAWLWYYRGTGNGAGGWFYNYATVQNEWR